MSLLPSIRSTPQATPSCVTIETQLTLEHWIDATLYTQRHVLGRQRRVFFGILASLWFLTLLGLFSNWFTGSDDKTFANFMKTFDVTTLTPALVFLGLSSLGFGLLLWTQKLRLKSQLRSLADDDFRSPWTLQFRIDEEGITVSEPDRTNFMAWAIVASFEETPDYLVFSMSEDEAPCILPKLGVSNADIQRIRAWMNSYRGLNGSASDAMALPDAPVRIRYTLDAQDRTAAIIRQHNLLATTRQRRWGFMMLVIGFSLVFPVLFAFAWMVDPQRVPFDIAFPLYLQMFGDLFWQPAALFAVIVGVFIIFHSRLRTRAARKWGQYLQERARQDEIQVVADEDGLKTVTRGNHSQWNWTAFKGFERTETHVFLPLRCHMVVPLPRRAFDASSLARFEELAERHLVTKGVS